MQSRRPTRVLVHSPASGDRASAVRKLNVAWASIPSAENPARKGSGCTPGQGSALEKLESRCSLPGPAKRCTEVANVEQYPGQEKEVRSPASVRAGRQAAMESAPTTDVMQARVHKEIH